MGSKLVNTADKIFSLNALSYLVESWKKENQIIAFTNGCFDIIHLGHVDYLEKARHTADKLIVAINTDISIKRLKGEERPINDQNSRSRALAALSFVDAVVLFEEDTPLNVIKKLSPNILIKGDDYLSENIVGADFVLSNGGRVSTIPLVLGYSTTNIINRIKNLN